MAALDLAQIAELGSLRLLSARVRLALRRLEEGEELGTTEYSLRKACEFLGSVSTGKQHLDALSVETQTAELLSQYGLARDAWRLGRPSSARGDETFDAVIEDLRGQCGAAIAGRKPGEQLRSFFDALFRYTGEELERRSESSPEGLPELHVLNPIT